MDRAIEGGRDKAAEQGMRLVGAALEFRVELRADEPGVALRFDDLDERAVGGETGEAHAGVREVVAEVVVELVAVAVALPDLRRVVERAGERALFKHAGILAKAHRAALGRHADLLGHERDDGMRRRGGELRARRVIPAEHVARKFDDCDLHAEADAEVRDAALARVLRG